MTRYIETMDREPPAREAEVVREYGPFEASGQVHGVSYDGRCVWAAVGPNDRCLRAGQRAHGARARPPGRRRHRLRRQAPVADRRIPHRQDRRRHRCGARLDSGAGGRQRLGPRLAEGSLWVGRYRARRTHRIDPADGRILRTIETKRFATGVTWVDGQLWHGTSNDDASEIRRIDAETGAVLERLRMPKGTGVSGLESDGAGLFYAGGGSSGKVRAVPRPKAPAAA